MSRFLSRLREPSTWDGMAVLFALFGLSHEQAQVLTDLLAALAAHHRHFHARASLTCCAPASNRSELG